MRKRPVFTTMPVPRRTAGMGKMKGGNIVAKVLGVPLRATRVVSRVLKWAGKPGSVAHKAGLVAEKHGYGRRPAGGLAKF